MTEEEKLAEEYATENYEQCIYDVTKGWQTDYEARKQAFSAGLKAKTQWHKVVDGDLPEYQMGENYAQIPCLCKIKNYGLGVRVWNVKEQCWDTEDGDDYYCEKDRVIEWQEIYSVD